ncbi:hypothetical protein IGU65_004745, partial [Escherichia coli]|nr:hypothetical protein [Escherichia coli]
MLKAQGKLVLSQQPAAERVVVENNYLSVSEKTELELAKQTLKNSKDPVEREKAQQKYDALLEKDISSDK